MTKETTGCRICPRECGADRANGETGRCGVKGMGIYLARAALHRWEEPCISGTRGAGTVFFTGCPLQCVYCQNRTVSSGEVGKEVSREELCGIFLRLQEEGAENINLVTPTHYTPQIIRAVMESRRQGLRLPIVYNCGGYEKVETLKRLQGIVDIYLTDFKYWDAEAAGRYSAAPDYPCVASAALQEMVRQQSAPVFGRDGSMKRGVVVRHLLLPGRLADAKAVVRHVYNTYGNRVYLSLMRQYTPLPWVKRWPELDRRVTKREYERWIDDAISLGVETAFIQEGRAAAERFIPKFDYEGL